MKKIAKAKKENITISKVYIATYKNCCRAHIMILKHITILEFYVPTHI